MHIALEGGEGKEAPHKQHNCIYALRSIKFRPTISTDLSALECTMRCTAHRIRQRPDRYFCSVLVSTRTT